MVKMEFAFKFPFKGQVKHIESNGILHVIVEFLNAWLVNVEIASHSNRIPDTPFHR